jgi:hypothetical protein
VAEVRVVRIDRHVAPGATLGVERRELVHLIHQRREVLLLGAADLVAQLEHLLVEILELMRAGAELALQMQTDALEDAQLFVDDRLITS